ncbi:hypothetical protein HMPREF3201_00197 [Megasphaera sp. MJR8396C]|nr:hypothetical protein HMPREF3201_00197 [Megasphaera sp. MJR8396C]
MVPHFHSASLILIVFNKERRNPSQKTEKLYIPLKKFQMSRHGLLPGPEKGRKKGPVRRQSLLIVKRISVF